MLRFTMPFSVRFSVLQLVTFFLFCLFIVVLVLFISLIYVYCFRLKMLLELTVQYLIFQYFCFVSQLMAFRSCLFVCFGVFPYISRHTLHNINGKYFFILVKYSKQKKKIWYAYIDEFDRKWQIGFERLQKKLSTFNADKMTRERGREGENMWNTIVPPVE